jgi:hypothetical protein
MMLTTGPFRFTRRLAGIRLNPPGFGLYSAATRYEIGIALADRVVAAGEPGAGF